MKFLQVKWTGLETREKRNSRSSFIYHSISTLYGRRNTCFCSFLMSSSKPTSMTWVPEPPTENEPSLPTQPTPQMLLRNSPEDVLWTGLSGFSTLTTLPWNRVALFGRWRVRDQKCGDHHLVEQSRCLVPATAPLLGLVRWCQHTSNQSSLFHIMHRTHYLFIFQHGPENQSFHCNELWQDGIVRQTTSAMTSYICICIHFNDRLHICPLPSSSASRGQHQLPPPSPYVSLCFKMQEKPILNPRNGIQFLILPIIISCYQITLSRMPRVEMSRCQ